MCRPGCIDKEKRRKIETMFKHIRNTNVVAIFTNAPCSLSLTGWYVDNELMIFGASTHGKHERKLSMEVSKRLTTRRSDMRK